ncbi:hypothetical protein EC973_008362 [Apophysomyces ossiformis]|uniref:Amino acid transporter transmembrane domain-containing protein n=1 Tax=Apophysomyces ossiformis TaxID=679940 RepID=A0A8H7EP78_9FUNG|nr:hypothetical protein EC973_008362 [Apophysomyces ossiformis]
MARIRGNEKFQAKVELTTIAQLYLGKKYHYFIQIILFLSLQSINVASIILSAQTMDNMFVALFHGTCGLGIAPGGWICVTNLEQGGNSPFDSAGYFLFTFGFLFTALMVIPLGFFTLVENIIVQIISFVILLVILVIWVVFFGIHGLDPSMLPAVGPNSTQVLGIVVFNYSYITTIPSWVNSLKPGVSIHKAMWTSVVISTIIYLVLGSTVALVTTYIFPIVVLVTSIPVFTIVIRSNLLRGQICSRPWAIFWSCFSPWLIAFIFQSKDWLNTLQNWSSLFFQSPVNYIVPFALYFVSRRYEASVEPPPSNPEKVDADDIMMYNPEENRSISLRREPSRLRSNISSRLEQSRLSKKDTMDSKPTQSPRLDIPAIVFSSDVVDEPTGGGSPMTTTPTATTPTRLSPRLSIVTGPFTEHVSTKALGISGPAGSDTEHEMTEEVVLSSLSCSSTVQKDDKTLSPPTSSPNMAKTPPSPMSSRSSGIISSFLAPRSPSVVPSFTSAGLEEAKMGSFLEVEEENFEPFAAFERRRWLNPFVLAIVSSILITIAVIFMIIYNVVMLALGTDLLS